MIDIKQRFTVIGAVMIRDIRTRFGRSHFSYLLAIIWPLAHITFIIIGFLAANRIMPLGSDPALFVVSGAVPYILCLYPARMMGMTIETNRPLFLFPVVKVLDVILARATVEFLTAFVVLIILYCGLLACGVQALPSDSLRWAEAVVMTIYLSISLGLLNCVIVSIIRMWHITFVLLMVVLYLTSGVFILPETYPQNIQNLMWFNPLLHCVSWFRSSYYDGYGDATISFSYLFWVSTTVMFLGLAGERFLRGKILNG
ncbi:ABC transporter permease [Oryzifoliimicrobium ureilyticus]|uniref:ABC transporter permease n=1 Tax=Oryzifoliimicrobium ureilyticus TaxID=3113724 RepID=UPI0030760A0C